jgi:transcriptional regulator with XRE-family HTH domain
MTLRELSKRAGVSKETISELERGLRHPQMLTIGKLAEALNVSVDELVEEAADPKAPAPTSPERVKREERRKEEEQVIADLLERQAERTEAGAQEYQTTLAVPVGRAYELLEGTLALEMLYERMEAEGLLSRQTKEAKRRLDEAMAALDRAASLVHHPPSRAMHEERMKFARKRETQQQSDEADHEGTARQTGAAR